jgi:histone H4
VNAGGKKTNSTNVGDFSKVGSLREKEMEGHNNNGIKGIGQGGCKRRKDRHKGNQIQGISRPGIRRLARRGGVKKLSGLVYEETRSVLKTFLENVIRDSALYMEHAKRKTMTSHDVVCALKRQGLTIYGFGM